MSRRVVIDENSRVDNIIELEDGANWTPPDGHIVFESERLGKLGDIWDGRNFITPEPEVVEIDEKDIRLEYLIGKLKNDTMSLKEIREFLRAMYGLDVDER